MNLSEITQQMGEVGKTLSDSVPELLIAPIWLMTLKKC